MGLRDHPFTVPTLSGGGGGTMLRAAKDYVLLTTQASFLLLRRLTYHNYEYAMLLIPFN